MIGRGWSHDPPLWAEEHLDLLYGDIPALCGGSMDHRQTCLSHRMPFNVMALTVKIKLVAYSKSGALSLHTSPLLTT